MNAIFHNNKKNILTRATFLIKLIKINEIN